LFLDDSTGTLDILNFSGGLVEVAADSTVTEVSKDGVLRELKGKKLKDIVVKNLKK
jgi:hypothetical protein